MDHHLSIPSRVENLAYPCKKIDVCFVSGHERVGPQGLSRLLTPVVPLAKKRTHQVGTPGGTCSFENMILRKETFAYHIFCSMFMLLF